MWKQGLQYDFAEHPVVIQWYRRLAHMGIFHMLDNATRMAETFLALRGIFNSPLSLRHLLTTVSASCLPDLHNCSPWTATAAAINLDRAYLLQFNATFLPCLCYRSQKIRNGLTIGHNLSACPKLAWFPGHHTSWIWCRLRSVSIDVCGVLQFRGLSICSLYQSAWAEVAAGISRLNSRERTHHPWNK